MMLGLVDAREAPRSGVEWEASKAVSPFNWRRATNSPTAHGAAIKSDRECAKAALERIKVQSAPQIALESDQIERLGAFMRERIATGETTFRKAYPRSIVDAVEIDDKAIRIHGSKTSLEQAVIAGEQIGKGVRGFIPKWRARKDSNL